MIEEYIDFYTQYQIISSKCITNFRGIRFYELQTAIVNTSNSDYSVVLIADPINEYDTDDKVT